MKAAGKPLPFEEPLEVVEKSVEVDTKVDATLKNTVEMTAGGEIMDGLKF